ncbi:MAG: GNAT family N-acetyltransferase [Lachnospiraceae bacterium]|jgi:GNAT superfamily N-acetyltransferase|nr:GNAT family N-acetyltransferase [Lachnospiraceae bacterium]
MSHPAPPVSVCHCFSLSDTLQKSVLRLTEYCCAHDSISLSYPLLPEDGASDHYLISDDQGFVLCALALVPLDSSFVECQAFTHPLHRRKGYFSRLLSLALQTMEECDLLFPVSESCLDTMAVLRTIGGELAYKEHMMEQILPKALPPKEDSDTIHSFLVPPDNIFIPDALWTFFSSGTNKDLKNTPAGSCYTSLASPTCLCLHHVEIDPCLRGQGLGTRMILLLLSHLNQAGIRRVILQVSGDNPAAISLYKKTGFHITETLSYYLY